MFFQLALVITFALGLHRTIVTAAYKSFLTMPVIALEAGLMSPAFSDHMVSILSALFEFAFRLSLPVILICFLIDLAYGIKNRQATQIKAYFLSLPAKMVGGLLILVFLLPFLLDDFTEHHYALTRFLEAVVGL